MKQPLLGPPPLPLFYPLQEKGVSKPVSGPAEVTCSFPKHAQLCATFCLDCGQLLGSHNPACVMYHKNLRTSHHPAFPTPAQPTVFSIDSILWILLIYQSVPQLECKSEVFSVLLTAVFRWLEQWQTQSKHCIIICWMSEWKTNWGNEDLNLTWAWMWP